ncbi:hypothetical protein AMTR_s00093p00066420 [Amborella trichopoda]|uniref:Uncharacterized protein n=1 Tax=Amborella trichopoda TaxID=13333 RepID=W1NSU5_AMBTC|nr:hypothetical protein AMTR_s00093p00066420 [Amborella trichopoda]
MRVAQFIPQEDKGQVVQGFGQQNLSYKPIPGKNVEFQLKALIREGQSDSINKRFGSIPKQSGTDKKWFDNRPLRFGTAEE